MDKVHYTKAIPIIAASSVKSELAWTINPAELDVVVPADDAVLVELAPDVPLLGLDVPLGLGVPNRVAPLGRGPGSADADAPCPTRAPIPCCNAIS